EGYEMVLVNNNPATIMTDPEMAHRTYIEPLTVDAVEKIIAAERPDALLPTVGGQTGLNLSVELAEAGVLERYGVELIGAKLPAIRKAESRELFKQAMENIGLDMPRSHVVRSMHEAMRVVDELGFPAILRPGFTLSGKGGGIAYNLEEFRQMVEDGLRISPVSEMLIEESIIGWKEFELEVMRDCKDNVVIICSIENVDPMGLHTGDSITVAPAQTLTDKEYQLMRDSSLRVIREIGVDTGGSNIQFAVCPETGRQTIIEMNPRVSRSSALASKATGFPIAKIAAKLAVGYTLDEIPNDITKETPASFEPTIDYVVTKIPRWAFEKFPQVDATLTTSMKSVGEAMSIGRTFKESLQKGLRSMENGWTGLDDHPIEDLTLSELTGKLSIPNTDRIFYVRQALRKGMSLEEVYRHTKIDPFFLHNIQQLIDLERTAEKNAMVAVRATDGDTDSAEELRPLVRQLKRYGFGDAQLAAVWGVSETNVRTLRKSLGVVATYKLVDTCAAEFEAYTPYYYSTYEDECEVRPATKPKVMILGGGPNRIGQGIEFDYCCVHAAFALREDGWETIMVNSNPETVSTDYDTSDRLYFEPLTRENVLDIIDREQPEGVIVQFGGQTPLNLAVALKEAGVPIIGTDPDDIDRAEDRKRFKEVLDTCGLKQPPNGTATSFEEARAIADVISYPCLVRPSYVLGGRAMQIVHFEEELREYLRYAVDASPERPILIDKYLEDAIEVDVDAICDGETVVVGGVMEHIEEAGIHSGDSDCVLPTYSLGDDQLAEIRRATVAMAKELNVIGLMNVQFAIRNDDVYVLEVNPRASRTIPFVSKAIGVPLAKLAARVMTGKKLPDLGYTEEITPEYFSVKAPVFPFDRLPGADPLLGPEMKSTGEVMGIDTNYGRAFAKAQMGTGYPLPTEGTAFISVKNKDKRAVTFVARELHDLGFQIVATHGTAKVLTRAGIPTELVYSIGKGRPTIHDYIMNNAVDLIVNTPSGGEHAPNEDKIRMLALEHNITLITTLAGAQAGTLGIQAMRDFDLAVKPIQDYYAG
ncbi:carbamoyl-phosphate synthase large subunit, partial [Candidatus Poribacteria bacterium]|nr:carbamoyl-phosphate synthase large subunit [Candidatus Poribacteria bacterium]